MAKEKVRLTSTPLALAKPVCALENYAQGAASVFHFFGLCGEGDTGRLAGRQLAAGEVSVPGWAA